MSIDQPLSAPPSIEAFMAQAVAMELEASQRYADLADAMDVHNNAEVSALFRKMAIIEGRHAEQVMAQMGWSELPMQPRAPGWEGCEAAETVPSDEIHYLMQPWHALQLALAAEQRAERFFTHLASIATDTAVRQAALELQEEEREHVELIQAWLKKVPQPEADWAVDPDPPHYTD
ncbi:MAG: ferritin family protein [Rubrivivax sp.]|nr:ferritin family protein [Rubrivivax sp.]MDP3082549.1 ferritin family protein [Rubrivivax sp.]